MAIQKGFISTSTLIIFFLIAILLIGGGFGVYKYSQVISEKQLVEVELLEQKDKEIEILKQQIEQEQELGPETATSSEAVVIEEVSGESVSDIEPEVVEVIKTVTEYVPIEVPQVESEEEVLPLEDVIEEDSLGKEEELVEQVIEIDEPDFLISAVKQTSFPDGFGGIYGGYEVVMLVTAPENSDVLIPQTTTNTVGAARIGFSYSVIGENFRGVENSQVICPVRRDGNCRVKAGKSSEITTTIWLYPDADSNGNYSVMFDEMYYFFNGEWYTYDIARTTAKINLMY